jgi:hypothetical protein
MRLDANARVFHRGPELASILIEADGCQDGPVRLVELDSVLEQVVQDLAVDLFLDVKRNRYAVLLVDSGRQVALLDDHVEWLEDVFDDFRELGAGALDVIDLQAVLLDLHLRELRLNVEFEQFARTPDDLHKVFLLLSDRVVVEEHL